MASVEHEARLLVRERISLGKDVPIGFVDTGMGKIHAGYGIWIGARDYDLLRLRSTINPSKFIANVARLIFTDEVMKKSSVTGTVSNVQKSKKAGAVPKPALSNVGLGAVAAITRYWMKTIGKPEGEIIKELSRLTKIIAKKISDMNRPVRRTRELQKTKKKEKKKMLVMPEANVDSDDTEQDESSRDDTVDEDTRLENRSSETDAYVDENVGDIEVKDELCENDPTADSESSAVCEIAETISVHETSVDEIMEMKSEEEADDPSREISEGVYGKKENKFKRRRGASRSKRKDETG